MRKNLPNWVRHSLRPPANLWPTRATPQRQPEQPRRRLRRLLMGSAEAFHFAPSAGAETIAVAYSE